MLVAKSSVVLFLQILSGLHRVPLTSSWGLSEQKFSKELCYSKPCGSLRVGAWPPENAICSFDCYHYYYYWLVPMFIKAEKDLVRDFDTLGFKESIIRDVCSCPLLVMFVWFSFCEHVVPLCSGPSCTDLCLDPRCFSEATDGGGTYLRISHTHCQRDIAAIRTAASRQNVRKKTILCFFKIMSFLFFGNNYRNRTLFLICFCNIKWLSPPTQQWREVLIAENLQNILCWISHASIW